MGEPSLTVSQKAMVLAMRVLPKPVMQRLAVIAAKRAAAKQTARNQTDSD